MQIIYKYPIEIQEVFSLKLPVNARILSVQVQDGNPCIWAILNVQEKQVEIRTFEIFGTAHQIPPGVRNYIATFQTPPFVWHLFEIK